MTRYALSSLLGFCTLGFVAGILGCSQPESGEPATISGTVYFQNQPLMGGLIVFSPDITRGTSGKPFQATINQDGEYLITPDRQTLPATGWYRIAIADPPGLFTAELGYPEFPKALRRPDRSGLEREVLAHQANIFHFHIEVSE